VSAGEKAGAKARGGVVKNQSVALRKYARISAAAATRGGVRVRHNAALRISGIAL